MKKANKKKAEDSEDKNKGIEYILPMLGILFSLILPDFGADRYVSYAIKVLIGLFFISIFWNRYKEIKVRFDPLAWLYGLLVIVIWILLEFLNGSGEGFDPMVFSGYLPYMIIALKVIGMVIVAAVIEELFIRSFLIRMLVDVDFDKVKIGKYTFFSFLLTVIVFGLFHGSSFVGSRLIAGLVSGIMFNLWLYYRKDIFSCIQAHAAANLFLAIYVIITQNWYLW